MSNTYNDYFDALGRRESDGHYDAVNQYGYLGKYQMGESALIGAGYYKSDGKDDRKYADKNWTGKDGVHSRADYLANKEAQDNAVKKLTENNWNWIQKLGLDKYIGKTVNGVEITKSGLLGGAHLGGVGNVLKFLKAGVEFKDGNKTNIKEYINLFSGYDVPFDVSPSPVLSPPDNSLLNVNVSLGDFLGLDGAQLFTNGAVMVGSDYYVTMPSNILNGDGYDNVAMSGIVSDFYRPGNMELSSLSFDDEIQRFQLTGSIEGPEDFMYLASFHSSSVSARSTINIDPLVLDLNGDGVKLISFADSKVLFDVDADGFKEATAWASPQDGILVLDKNANGQIDDITETISEYFTDGVKDGLEALKTLDTNSDNIFDAHDEKYNDLRVWVDADSDGVTDPGELKTLAELNIKSIDLNRQEADRERLAGSAVLSRSTMEMTDDTTREVAAIDFTTNPMGYEFNALENYLGVKALSQEGTSTFLVQDPNGVVIDLDDAQVTNIYGGAGDDKISGSIGKDWLAGGAGGDTLFGDAGNDVLIIDADDLPENIDGGRGRDVVFANDTRGVFFNLANSHVEVMVGGTGDDILVGGGNSNVFIDGGKGDDIIVGGAADDALSGSDGGDLLDGDLGDDILRGHRGNDILIGNDGNDHMDGGQGNDVLQGGKGGDLLVGSEGNDTLDGGEGRISRNIRGATRNTEWRKQPTGSRS
ncbi:MAG: hypothetical protein IPN19_00055 [Elusimicrobia bacterium]|nr:hypothetical protein [Elusimicrobiota bacterium]